MKAGWDALDRDDFRTAERIARAAIARAADDPEALYLLGSTLLFEGRHAEAREPLASAAPRIARRGAQFRLGYCLLALGDLRGAETALRRECATYPESADAHNVLGVALVNQSRRDDALAAFLAALRIDPDHVEANNNAGDLLTALGRREEAVLHFQRALQKNPGLADGHLNLGLLLQSLHRYDAAIASFRRAVELAPQLGYALGSLVWCELLAYGWPQVADDIAMLRKQVGEGQVPVRLSRSSPPRTHRRSSAPAPSATCASCSPTSRRRSGAARRSVEPHHARLRLGRLPRARHHQARDASLRAARPRAL